MRLLSGWTDLPSRCTCPLDGPASGYPGHLPLDEPHPKELFVSLSSTLFTAYRHLLVLKAENATNYHYKQMERNYDEYIGQAATRVAKSRANNPGRDRMRQANRIEKAQGAKSFHCEPCNISFGTKQRLQNHEKSDKHFRKEIESNNRFKCAPCNLAYHNQSNLTRHEKTQRHLKQMAALSSSELD